MNKKFSRLLSSVLAFAMIFSCVTVMNVSSVFAAATAPSQDDDGVWTYTTAGATSDDIATAGFTITGDYNYSTATVDNVAYTKLSKTSTLTKGLSVTTPSDADTYNVTFTISKNSSSDSPTFNVVKGSDTSTIVVNYALAGSGTSSKETTTLKSVDAETVLYMSSADASTVLYTVTFTPVTEEDANTVDITATSTTGFAGTFTFAPATIDTTTAESTDEITVSYSGNDYYIASTTITVADLDESYAYDVSTLEKTAKTYTATVTGEAEATGTFTYSDSSLSYGDSFTVSYAHGESDTYDMYDTTITLNDSTINSSSPATTDYINYTLTVDVSDLMFTDEKSDFDVLFGTSGYTSGYSSGGDVYSEDGVAVTAAQQLNYTAASATVTIDSSVFPGSYVATNSTNSTLTIDSSSISSCRDGLLFTNSSSYTAEIKVAVKINDTKTAYLAIDTDGTLTLTGGSSYTASGSNDNIILTATVPSGSYAHLIGVSTNVPVYGFDITVNSSAATTYSVVMGEKLDETYPDVTVELDSDTNPTQITATWSANDTYQAGTQTLTDIDSYLTDTTYTVPYSDLTFTEIQKGSDDGIFEYYAFLYDYDDTEDNIVYVVGRIAEGDIDKYKLVGFSLGGSEGAAEAVDAYTITDPDSDQYTSGDYDEASGYIKNPTTDTVFKTVVITMGDNTYTFNEDGYYFIAFSFNNGKPTDDTYHSSRIYMLPFGLQTDGVTYDIPADGESKSEYQIKNISEDYSSVDADSAE